MSTLEVKVVRLNIENHPNAERLNIAKIAGTEYTAVVGKEQFKTGDLAIFIPEDAVVPEKIQNYLATTQKITVRDGRIRCSRIRGYFSDGLCLTPSEWLPAEMVKEDKDITEFLGITKYEPPPPKHQGLPGSKGINHHYQNEHFKRYTGIENYKKYSNVIQNGEEVIITIKAHGMNWRAGWVKRPAASLTRAEKVKKFFGFKVNDREYLVGSHNTIRRKAKNADKVEDIFCKVAEKYNIEKITKELSEQFKADVIVFGELIGSKVQVGYDYGFSDGEHGLKVFDIMVGGKFLDWQQVLDICATHSLPMVEVLHYGAWNNELTKLSEAVDEYNGKKYVREGIVIKAAKERKDPRLGRVIVKYISETFRLDKKNSSFH